jgi:hypothetical protein
MRALVPLLDSSAQCFDFSLQKQEFRFFNRACDPSRGVRKAIFKLKMDQWFLLD